MAEPSIPASKQETKLAYSTRDALDDALRRAKVARYGAHRGVRLGLIGAAIVAVLGIALVIVFRAPGNDPNACLHEHAGFIDVKATCPEPVQLERDGDVIIAYPGVSLEERGSGTRVRAGKAGFVAQQRSDGNTLRVLVSHGVMEITGTRFTVSQGEGHGDVKVEEGTVIYRDDDGTDVTLKAGGELTWPLKKPTVVALGAIPLGAPKAPASANAARAKSPAAEAAPAVAEDDDEEVVEEAPPVGVMSMEEVLQRIATLRSQKRTSEAVALLVSQSQRGDITHPQMARLSWEIGLFVQDSGDKAAACKHWKTHARRYPYDGRSEQVSELVKACE